jgi:membrane protein implicated in regulation of membrane protease activity
MQNLSSPKQQQSGANDPNSGRGQNLAQALVFTWYGELAFWATYAVASTLNLSWWLASIAALLSAATIVYLVQQRKNDL